MWYDSAKREMRILMGKPEGMKTLGRDSGRWTGAI